MLSIRREHEKRVQGDRFASRWGIMLLLSMGSVVSADSVTIKYETIVRSGDQVPGAADGVVFRDFEAPIIGMNGHIAFLARIEGPGVAHSDDKSLFLAWESELYHLARERETLPGVPDERILSSMRLPGSIDGEGRVAFSSNLNFAFNTTSLFYGDKDGVRCVVYPFQQAPWDPDQSLFGFGPDPGFTEQGWAITRGGVSAGGIFVNPEVWRLSDDGIERLVAYADPAPGLPEGSTFQIQSSPIVCNAAGDFAFLSSAVIPGESSQTITNGYWIYRDGVGHLVIDQNGAPPEIGPGASFAALYPPTMDSSGKITFNARFTGPGVSSVNNFGIWRGDETSLELVLRRGTQVPRGEAGLRFIVLPELMYSNERGDIAMVDRLFGTGVNQTNDGVVTLIRDGVPIVVAREGAVAPSDEVGAYFRGPTTPFSRLALNNLGQVAFLAETGGRFSQSGSRFGVWATTESGQLIRVLQRGMKLNVGNSEVADIREVLRPSFRGGSSGQDGYRGGLNDRGELVLSVQFTDGSEAIVVARIFATESPGDINGDGSVGLADFNIMALNFGFGPGATREQGDLNGDGWVDLADFNLLATHFGQDSN